MSQSKWFQETYPIWKELVRQFNLRMAAKGALKGAGTIHPYHDGWHIL